MRGRPPRRPFSFSPLARTPSTLQRVEESRQLEAVAAGLRWVEDDAEAEDAGARLYGAVAHFEVDEDGFQLLRRAVLVDLRPRQHRARDARAPQREPTRPARRRLRALTLGAPVRPD